MNILLVEDNMQFASLILKQFELDTDYKVTHSSDGEDALNKLKSNIYDIIILDIILPSIDGLDLLHYIKSENSLNNNSFILIATALSNERLFTELKNYGYDYHLEKPYKFSQILNIINFLNSRQMSQSKLVEKNLLDTFSTNYLEFAGISKQYKGYDLLKESFIYMTLIDTSEDIRITKDLYPYLSKKFNTEITSIERNIRHAILKRSNDNLPKLSNLNFLLSMKNAYNENPDKYTN